MNKLSKLSLTLILFGIILIAAAPRRVSIANTTVSAEQRTVNEVQKSDSARNYLSDNSSEAFEVPGFELFIPRINLQKKVIANVNPASESDYMPIIAKNIAHGRYTRLPDQATNDGNVYLFAHSDGSSDFFKDLHKLRTDDQIKLRFKGKEYTYKVFDRFIIKPEDVWVYTGESATPTITLQTCENNGKERLIIKGHLTKVI